TLVVAEVKMKGVYLVIAQQINVTLYVFHRKEVTRNIKHSTTPFILGIINDSTCGYLPLLTECTIFLTRNNLTKRLYTMEHTCSCVSCDPQLVFIDVQLVPFCTEFRRSTKS